MANTNHKGSLRRLYAITTLVLVSLIMAGALIGQRFVASASKESTTQIAVRNSLLAQIRHIGDDVWDARESIEGFLLDPHSEERRNTIIRTISDATTDVEALKDDPWIRTNHQDQTIANLLNDLVELKQSTETFIRTRTDPALQYPAMALARDSMLPAQDSVYSALALALNEYGDNLSASEAKARTLFLDLRYYWSLTISNYRMYLANRMGSFAEKTLSQQETDIQLLIDQCEKIIQQLQELDNEGELLFQGSISLEQIQDALAPWLAAYHQVKDINHSGLWRTDAGIIQGRIEPLLESIWDTLATLSNTLEVASNQEMSNFTTAAKSQTNILWGLAALCTLMLLIGYFTLEYAVLNPIATVAKALKLEASGKTDITIPAANSSETQNLIDAFTEMRQQVHSRQMALEHQATHDSLTGLPNRNRLNDRIQQAIFTARRNQACLAMMLMDLNGFKEINDTLGHHTGDQLLKLVGKRLQARLREVDTVARLGGDEFAILLPSADQENATVVARKILSAMQEVFAIDDKHHLYVEGSIGIAIYPEHGEDPQTLTQKADVAMYVAKRKKLGSVIYDASLDENSVGRLALISDLRNAIQEDKLELYFQPQIDVNTRSVIGCEALLRWNHPEHGFVPPDQIVPIAEQTGLIKPLTRWVLETALQHCKDWQEQGLDFHVSVNLSVHNLYDKDIVEQVQNGLSTYEVNPEHLVLEVTESAMMADPERAIEILTELDKMGAMISIDDFGTGFSSLAYLKQLPVDELKVDRSFVMDMDNDENDAVIVRSTVDLAHNLGLKVVAEGVEDNEALNLLNVLGCDLAQGYYISRPLPVKEFNTWLGSYTAQSA